MKTFSFLLMMLTMGAGVAEAGKLVYAVSQTKAEIVCPGEDMQCPDDTTCCQTTSGQWACCPVAKATCCSDKKHCCPQYYSCDISGELCIRAIANKTVSWAKKLPASVRSKEVAASPENDICPGGFGVQCPPPGTCCKNMFGYYACCFYSGCCPGPSGCC